MSSMRVCMELDLLSVQVIKGQLCFFPLCHHQLYMIKIVCKGIQLENVNNYQVYKQKSRKVLFKMFTKGSFQVRKILKNIKIQEKYFHVRFEILCQLQQQRYSPAIRPFPKAKNSVICEEFPTAHILYLSIMNEIFKFLVF